MRIFRVHIIKKYHYFVGFAFCLTGEFRIAANLNFNWLVPAQRKILKAIPERINICPIEIRDIEGRLDGPLPHRASFDSRKSSIRRRRAAKRSTDHT